MRIGVFVSLLTLFSLLGCLSETTFQPNVPQPIFPTVTPPTVDFYFWISRTEEGWVHFENKSHEMDGFNWDFGFIDKYGNPASSTSKNPSYLFPANGKYLIKLQAIDADGAIQERTRILDLDNYN